MVDKTDEVVEAHDPLAFMDEGYVEPKDDGKPAAEGDADAGKAAGEGADGKTTPEAPAGKKAEEAADDDNPEGATTVDGKVMVPLSALLKERTRRQEKPAEVKPAAEEEAFVAPDPATDPKGFADYQQTVLTTNMVNQTLNVSERFARKEHPAELVDAVRDWALARFENDPDYAKKVLFDADPYSVAIADYQAEQRGNKLGKLTDAEIDELIAIRDGKKEAPKTPADGGAAKQPVAEAKPAAAQPKEPVKVPKTIADETNAGSGEVEMAAGAGLAFDSVFPK